ncbi:MAG: hypothetical protein ACT4O1_00525 [Gemmatimonadota bacterium]
MHKWILVLLGFGLACAEPRTETSSKASAPEIAPADERVIARDLTNRGLKFCDGGRSARLVQVDSVRVLSRKTSTEQGTDELEIAFVADTDDGARARIERLFLEYHRYDQGWLIDAIGDRNVISGFSSSRMLSDMCD